MLMSSISTSRSSAMSYIRIFPVVPNIGALGKVIIRWVSGFISRALSAGKYTTIFDAVDDVCALIVCVLCTNKRIKYTKNALGDFIILRFLFLFYKQVILYLMKY